MKRQDGYITHGVNLGEDLRQAPCAVREDGGGKSLTGLWKVMGFSSLTGTRRRGVAGFVFTASKHREEMGKEGILLNFWIVVKATEGVGDDWGVAAREVFSAQVWSLVHRVGFEGMIAGLTVGLILGFLLGRYHQVMRKGLRMKILADEEIEKFGQAVGTNKKKPDEGSNPGGKRRRLDTPCYACAKMGIVKAGRSETIGEGSTLRSYYLCQHHYTRLLASEGLFGPWSDPVSAPDPAEGKSGEFQQSLEKTS